MKISRDYQLAIEEEIPRRAKKFGSVIVQSPTGSGKSHIINKIVKRIIRSNKIPLVISDNLKIHGQLIKECSGIRIDAGMRELLILWGHCYVAMAQSLKNRNNILDQLKESSQELVVIVDECHRNTPTPIIKRIEPRYLIGFSATPHFKWSKHLPILYKDLILGPQINTLLNKGWLSDYIHIIRTGANLEELELKGLEYSEESQEKVFGSKQMYDGIFEDLPKYKKRKCVIYVASIKLCEQMYEQLLNKGYKVCRYHSLLPHYELDKFTKGDCDICVSVGTLTLGWDFPPIDLIILWRSTTSLPLYLQICGRASRILGSEDALLKYGLENYTKDHFTVLDYGGNFDRFGSWDMSRDWQELWQDPKRKRTVSTYAGVAGSKVCPVCKALLALTARSCYNCGYMYPEEEMKLIEGQILEVRNTLNNISGKRVGDLSASELASYARLHDRKNFAIRIARNKEQHLPGFLFQFAACMNYDERWARRMKEIEPDDVIEFANIKIKELQ